MSRKKKNKELLDTAVEVVEAVEVAEEVVQTEAPVEVVETEAPVEVAETEAPTQEPTPVVVEEVKPLEEKAIIEEVTATETTDEIAVLAERIKTVLKNNRPSTYIPKDNVAPYAKLILNGGTVAVLKNGRVAHTTLSIVKGGRKELMRKHPVKYILNDLL
jgi:hypothetical protein